MPNHNQNSSLTKSKKPFDKKKWREKTYSHKYKVQQFEERRKKVVLREYYKQLKRDQSTVPTRRFNPAVDTEDGSIISHPDGVQNVQSETKKKKLSAAQQAQLEFERKKQQKLEHKAELERKKEEREEALKQYKIKKMERFKKLSKKTKKGQPVMKDRLEMMLEKIQKSCSS